MISNIALINNAYINVINLVCYTMIFIGGFYVALHSRYLPKWATTSIWYLGLSSFFVACTIIVEWAVGQDHPMSHYMLGQIGELIMNVNLSIVVMFVFFHTVYHDYRCKKKRKPMSKIDDRLSL